MKKNLCAMAAMLALTAVMQVSAADSVLDMTNQMEKTIYGQVQEGAVVDRIAQIGITVTGEERKSTVNKDVENLYNLIEPNGGQASLKTILDLSQWTYTGQVSDESLLDRASTLERSLHGRIATGTLETRIMNLKNQVIGQNKKIILQPTEINNSNVFKVTINHPISTENIHEGDHFTFTVAEDITSGNLLVVPQGTVGVGTVISVKRARSFGRNAELNLSFGQIETVGGQLFTAIQGKEAQEKSKEELKAGAASVAGVALLGPIGLVGGLFIKGKDITYPSGQAFYVQPSEDLSTYGAGLEIAHASTKSKLEHSKKENKATSTTLMAKNINEKVTATDAKAKSDATRSYEKAKEKVKDVARKVEVPSEPVIVIRKAE